MDDLAHEAPRDERGRFIPGRSGNPSGKKPGTRNRATVLREALRDGEDVTAARIVIDKALAGHAVTARFVVDRLMPRPRGRTVDLDLPAGASARDVVVAYDAIVEAMASGEITPDEAVMVARVLDGRLKALKAAAAERQLARAESRTERTPSGPADKRSGGEGDGLGDRANEEMHGPGVQPSPRPSAACRRGNLPRWQERRFAPEWPAFDLHFAGRGAIMGGL